MAFLFGDTFDYASGATAGNLHWDTYGSSFGYATGRYGVGTAISAGTLTCTKILASSYATLIVAFAYKTPVTGTTDGSICLLYDGTTCHLSLYFDRATKKFVLYRGDATSLLATSTNQYSPETWYWFSWKSFINDSTGTSELRVNGSSTNWINFSGDTRNGANASVNKFTISGGFGNSLASFDDLIVMDTSGSTMNDHITERKAVLYVPNGAGGYTQWTPSAGNNYACVDEKAYNSDTDYVSTNTSTNRDAYTHETVSDFSTIDAVQVRGVIRRDDVASHTASLFYRRSSTNYDGTATTVNAGYGEICRIDEVDPATSAAWTVSNLNNTEIGVLLDT